MITDISNTIHPTAIVYPGVVIGYGNVIGPYCIIGAPPEWRGKENTSGQVRIGNNNTITGLVTIDSGAEDFTTIGDDCYLMKGCHVGHDAIINDKVTISCGARIGGHTVLGNGVNVGLNCVIHQKQTIAEGVMLGMGAVVTKKLLTSPYKTYAGNPAKYIGENIKHPSYPEYTINMPQWPDPE